MMTRADKIVDEYFEWMCGLVGRKVHYRRLLAFLHCVDFTYTIPMDSNRAEDGIGLRYRFGRERGYGGAETASSLDIRPCSVLEMMVALAIRCEEHIMGDPDIGDRTGQWFWGMVDSLGLSRMTDARFNAHLAGQEVRKFLSREYRRDGRGGLFWVRGCRRDLRTVEIWYQMCWYLDEILEG